MLSDEEKKLIGGSDAAAIAGVHPNKGPHAVWRRIVEGYDEPTGKAARRGTLMEPVIRAMAAEDFGLRFLGPRKLRDPKRPYVRASLDDVHQVELGDEEVAEFKSVGQFAASEYGEGDEDFPMHHHCQVQFYMAKSGLLRARLIALIGTDDLRQYRVSADAEIQGMLMEAVDRFYVDHIKTQRPPPPDASHSCAEWLVSKYPDHQGETMVKADMDAEVWAAALRKARVSLDEASRIEAEARNHLMAAIGSAPGIEGKGWRISYRQSKGRPSLDLEALHAEAKVPQDLIEKHTRRTPYRVFKPTFSKEQP